MGLGEVWNQPIIGQKTDEIIHILQHKRSTERRAIDDHTLQAAAVITGWRAPAAARTGGRTAGFGRACHRIHAASLCSARPPSGALLHSASYRRCPARPGSPWSRCSPCLANRLSCHHCVREPRLSPRRGVRSRCFHCPYSDGHRLRCHALGLMSKLDGPWQQPSECSGETGMHHECHPSSAECPVKRSDSLASSNTHASFSILDQPIIYAMFQFSTKTDHL